ncbi:MAG TPA: MBL fold metallo-hydrolase [Pyrinomonadaceae bacterium]
MTNQPLYLRPNVVAEPLFNDWYAWAYLISPVTAAMYVTNFHLKVMQSFVAAPQFHANALRNPEMIGGPYINYPPERAGEVRALMQKTVRERAAQLELAKAVAGLEKLLAGEEAGGYSLEPLYPKVPAPLRGYVELLYDLNNRPSVRFIEGLLYRSPYYDQTLQSVQLFPVEGDDRPFVFSTPRLEDGSGLRLRAPFADESWDALFRMRFGGGSYDLAREACRVEPAQEDSFRSLFTADAPRRPDRFEGDGVRVRYFGHACVLIESRRVSVLSDPVIGYEHGRGLPRYSLNDLPETIDYVVITHNHADHLMFETLLPLRHKIRNIIVPKNNGGSLADPSLKLALRHTGFPNVFEIDEMESVAVDGGAITGLPFLGEHCDLNIRTKSVYHVRLEGRSVVLAADSNNIEPELYGHLHGLTGDIDVLLIGLECDGAPMSWLYGPLATKPLARRNDQSRRTNASNYTMSIDIVDRLRPKHVYIYAMGQEPWLTYVTSIKYTDESLPIREARRLVEECRARGLAAELLYGTKDIVLTPAVNAAGRGL